MEDLHAQPLNSKILVTGFEPFGGESFNPSAWLLEQIQKDADLSSFCETLLLPVTFQDAHKPVLEALRNTRYQAWIGFGQAGGRSKIGLERVAINWQETSQPDNSGRKPEPGLLSPGGEQAYFSKGPLDKMKNVLDLAGIPSEISFTAGAYVCNSLYYNTLKALPPRTWGLFVHIPYVSQQMESKTEKIFMHEQVVWQATQLILQTSKNFNLSNEVDKFKV